MLTHSVLDDLLLSIHQCDLHSRISSDWHLWDDKQEPHTARLEVLLWGGDDMVLVVPARKGWEVASRFFRHVTGLIGEGPWRFNGLPGGGVFTYSAGLVLCNHKAPIHRIRDLAEALFIQGKK